jgi:uncharacterized protein YgbK (DUF1537 family)
MSRLLAWYGDDFTGSTDVLEALALQGISAVLFLKQPETLEGFEEYQAFGLAGCSRSQSPAWMDANLPGVFGWLQSVGARLTHYKVCSTFDSSPTVGNIGRALELGRAAMGVDWVPIVVGAPALRRYTAFGQLFAGVGDAVYRIDRHPTMSRHPVTPMLESDLRRHLALQTAVPVSLIHHLQLAAPPEPSTPFVLIDVLDEASLAPVGKLLWEKARFVVGSSGVQYALGAHWARQRPMLDGLTAVEQLLVLSGSCSPGTAEQILHARAQGFVTISLFEPGARETADLALGAGKSVILYSALGPETHRGDVDRLELAASSGRLLAELLDAYPGIRRVVVAGGDTSSAAGALLDIDALTFLNPVAPGAPLCRAWSKNPLRQGLEIIFKGGQCGGPAFFSQVKGQV